MTREEVWLRAHCAVASSFNAKEPDCVRYAAAHNRLIDYAIVAGLRGNDEAARSLRFSARLLAMLINNEHRRSDTATPETPK
jgi:flagellar basal body P-ring protein FlgI